MVFLDGCAYITLEQLSVSIGLKLHHQGIPRNMKVRSWRWPTWEKHPLACSHWVRWSTSENLFWRCDGSQIHLQTPSQDFSSAPEANVPLLPQLPPVLTGVRAGNWHRWHRPTFCYMLILLPAAAKLFRPSSMTPSLCIPIWHDF